MSSQQLPKPLLDRRGRRRLCLGMVIQLPCICVLLVAVSASDHEVRLPWSVGTSLSLLAMIGVGQLLGTNVVGTFANLVRGRSKK